VSLNLHIKRKHKGGNKSDRERFARDIFLALKNSKPVPETKFVIPEDFIPEIKKEFDRLKKIDFEEEFDPSTLFRYNVSNFENFDEVLGSQTENDDYGYDDNDDSISVGKRTKKTAKKNKRGKGNSSIGSDEDVEEIDQEENLSILSGARSEGIGRREPLQ
jgi:hypothetical protein